MDADEGRSPLRVGQVLDGKYQVGSLLGSGAMGLVYEGHHLLLDKKVAIKVLRPEVSSHAEVRDRFEAEARAAAAVGHPNIVSVTDMGREASGALYFVMDRLIGETLGARIARMGRLPLADVRGIALEVLAGLEAAHALGLVHRDLKPENIFLARGPTGNETTKILDFGVAKALAAVGRRDFGTSAGVPIGTPYYMAPEQAMGAADIDARVDVYAMGVTLYQALSGKLPFDGETGLMVIGSLMNDTPTPLLELCPELPPAVARLVDTAMSRDRQQRPATAQDLRKRLEAALAPAAPPPVRTQARPRPSASRPYTAPLELENDIPPPARPRSARAEHLPPPEPHLWRLALRLGRWVVLGILLWRGIRLAERYAEHYLEQKVGLSDAFDRLTRPRPKEPQVSILVEVTPEDSQVYLDGIAVDSRQLSVNQSTRIHRLSARREGYDPGEIFFAADVSKTVPLSLHRRVAEPRRKARAKKEK